MYLLLKQFRETKCLWAERPMVFLLKIWTDIMSFQKVADPTKFGVAKSEGNNFLLITKLVSKIILVTSWTFQWNFEQTTIYDYTNGGVHKTQKATNGRNKKSDETKFPLKSSGHNDHLKTQGYTIGGRLRLEIISKLIRSERVGNNFPSKTQDSANGTRLKLVILTKLIRSERDETKFQPKSQKRPINHYRTATIRARKRHFGVKNGRIIISIARG